MANTRRNRKNRRGGNVGVFGYVYKPVGHVISAANESVGAVANTGKGLVSTTARGVNRIGTSVTSHLNKAVSGLIAPIYKRRNTRRANRKNTRRNRKNRRNTRRH